MLDLVLISFLTLFSSCSKDNNNNNNDISNVDIKDEITSNETIENSNNPLLGKWIFIAGSGLNEKTFDEGYLYLYSARFDTHEKLKYILNDNSSFTVYYDNQAPVDVDYLIINNILLSNYEMNFKDGEIPNFNNEYSDALVGYYKGNAFNDYYNFGRNGKLEVIKDSNVEYNYYYVLLKIISME